MIGGVRSTYGGEEWCIQGLSMETFHLWNKTKPFVLCNGNVELLVPVALRVARKPYEDMSHLINAISYKKHC